jgi:hypothetical protein
MAREAHEHIFFRRAPNLIIPNELPINFCDQFIESHFTNILPHLQTDAPQFLEHPFEQFLNIPTGSELNLNHQQAQKLTAIIDIMVP